MSLPRRLWYELPLSFRKSTFDLLRRPYHLATSAREVLLDVTTNTALFESRSNSWAGRIFVVGRPGEIKWVSEQWLDGAAPKEMMKRVPLWRALREAEASKNHCDVTLTWIPVACRPLLKKNVLFLPGSLNLWVETHTALQLVAAANFPIGAMLRHIEEQELKCELHHSQESRSRFYDSFYLSYVAKRFGSRPFVRPRSFFDSFGAQGELLVITRHGEWLGAMFCIRHEDRYRFSSLGYREGDGRLRAKGVGHALYLHGFCRAAALGYSHVDLGPVRPVLHNPVLHYKRQWGARFRVDALGVRTLAVGFAHPTQAVKSFFDRHPFVMVGPGNELTAVAGSADRGVTSRLLKGHRSLGVDAVVAVAGFGATTPVLP